MRIDLAPEEVGDSIRETGFGFMFAPAHHAAMKHVVPTRKELGVRTIFNFLGPLTNPAGATRQLLGTSDRRYQETIAEALAGLGCEHALVVAGDDGLDELTISGRTRVIEVRDGRTSEWFVEPGDVGLAAASLDNVAGGSPAGNAHVARAVLAGERGPRPGSCAAQRGSRDLRRRRRGGPGRRRREGSRGGRLRCGRDGPGSSRRAGRNRQMSAVMLVVVVRIGSLRTR